MILISHLQINQISILNNPWGVDMPLNKLTKQNINSYDYNQTFIDESDFSIK